MPKMVREIDEKYTGTTGKAAKRGSYTGVLSNCTEEERQSNVKTRQQKIEYNKRYNDKEHSE